MKIRAAIMFLAVMAVMAMCYTGCMSLHPVSANLPTPCDSRPMTIFISWTKATGADDYTYFADNAEIGDTSKLEAYLATLPTDSVVTDQSYDVHKEMDPTHKIGHTVEPLVKKHGLTFRRRYLGAL